MAEKILNTRIQSKIDTLENWNKSEIGLLKGEIAIATVAAEAGNNLTEPVYMIKVGEDGKKTFKELEWNLYAKASDVLAACKDEEAFFALVDEAVTNSEVASNLAKAFEGLQWTDTVEEGKYVSAVSQADGKITVTKSNFPDFLKDIKISIGTYENIKDCIIIKDSKDNVITYADASNFVKDGMLDSVNYDETTNILTLTWNTDAGAKETEINLTGLVNTYTGEQGISVTGQVITLSEDVKAALQLGASAIQTITTNDVQKSETEAVPSGLIATKGQNNDYNIAIDDSITFIFNCGGAGVTTSSPDGGETTE